MPLYQYSNVQIEDTPKLEETSIIVSINYPKLEQRNLLHQVLVDILSWSEHL